MSRPSFFRWNRRCSSTQNRQIWPHRCDICHVFTMFVCVDRKIKKTRKTDVVPFYRKKTERKYLHCLDDVTLLYYVSTSITFWKCDRLVYLKSHFSQGVIPTWETVCGYLLWPLEGARTPRDLLLYFDQTATLFLFTSWSHHKQLIVDTSI